MKFIVNNNIFTEFDSPIIGIIFAKGINNSTFNPEITKALREEEINLRKKLEGIEIPQHPHIITWREAYRKFGSKPSEYRSSVEALTRRVMRGGEIGNINPLVDLYNFISIKYIVPVGAEDLDKIKGNLELTFAKGNEYYTALGKDQNDPPKPGEVIYKDYIGVICRRWNWREGERTKIDESTKNAVIVIESLVHISIENAIHEMSDLVKKYCGGEMSYCFLNKNLREIEF